MQLILFVSFRRLMRDIRFNNHENWKNQWIIEYSFDIQKRHWFCLSFFIDIWAIKVLLFQWIIVDTCGKILFKSKHFHSILYQFKFFNTFCIGISYKYFIECYRGLMETTENSTLAVNGKASWEGCVIEEIKIDELLATWIFAVIVWKLSHR